MLPRKPKSIRFLITRLPMESSLDEAPMTATALGRNRDSSMSSSFLAGFAAMPGFYFFYFPLNPEPMSGGAGYSPQRAAANFSSDPATPPSRLEELQTGREA
jgi:hypothetical protein